MNFTAGGGLLPLIGVGAQKLRLGDLNNSDAPETEELLDVLEGYKMIQHFSGA